MQFRLLKQNELKWATDKVYLRGGAILKSVRFAQFVLYSEDRVLKGMFFYECFIEKPERLTMKMPKMGA